MRAPCRTRARSLPVAALALLLAGCGSSQDTLQGHSRQSKAIAHLFWVMFVGAWIVFAFVLALLVIAFLRRRRRGVPPEQTSRAARAREALADGFFRGFERRHGHQSKQLKVRHRVDLLG